GVTQEIDAVGKQEPQRRLRQRIDVLSGELAVAHHDRRAVGDDVDAARLVVIEPDLARLLDIELALGLPSLWADLGEVARHVLRAREIGADLVDQRALLGLELCVRLLLRRRLLRLLLRLLLLPAATAAAQEWRQPFLQLLQRTAALRLLVALRRLAVL